MSLSGRILSQLIFDALQAADEAVAPIINGERVGVNTPQKLRERKAFSNALGTTIINYLVKNTEVIIPDHPTGVAMTGVGGPGPHAHTTNQPPIPHIIGEIE